MASPWIAFRARRSDVRAKVRPEDGGTQPMWLTVSGFALALVVSIGGSATVFFGFRLPGWLALPLIIVWVTGQGALNSWTITVRAGDPGRWLPPGRRTVCSLAEGLVVAAAATFWFIGGIGVSTPAAGATGQEHDLQLLRDERAELLSVLGRPIPDPADDPEAVRLGRQVSATGDELRRADHEVLCELDGTCGTGVAGRGLAYYKKVEYRDSVKRDLDTVSAQWQARKAELTQEAGRLRSGKGTATTRVTEIDRLLAARTPAHDQPSGAAVDRFFNDRGSPSFLVIYLGAFLGFLVADWLFLAVLLRFGRRRAEEWELDFGTPNGSAKRAISFHEYEKSRDGAAADPEDGAR